MVQNSRPIARLLGMTLSVLLLFFTVLAVIAHAQRGERRDATAPRSMETVTAVARAIEACAAERGDGRYQDAAGVDCLDERTLLARDPRLARVAAAGAEVHITSTDAGFGYVAQAGTSGEQASWYAIVRGQAGHVQRRCSTAPLGAQATTAGSGHDVPGCEGGFWRAPR